MKRAVLPLLVFAVLVAFLGVGLTLNPRDVPSPLIGKPAPPIQLPRVDAPDQLFASGTLQGQVWLLNVWASWCGGCRQEHSVLTELARTGAVPIYGLNYKDKLEPAMTWLQDFGNPYKDSFFDTEGRTGLDYGVYGVPETFLIDKHGVIRYKHAGPITPDLLRTTILPLVSKLNG